MNNRKNMRFIAAMVSTLVGLGTLNSFAGDAPNPFKETLSGVPPIELPAKAAQVVKETKASQRQTATINVVKAAVGINPAAAPAIVGAIATTTPEMASAAAGAAAAAQPKQAGDADGGFDYVDRSRLPLAGFGVFDHLGCLGRQLDRRHAAQRFLIGIGGVA